MRVNFKYLVYIVIAIGLISSFQQKEEFLNQQLKYERVRLAQKDKSNVINKLLKQNNLNLSDFHILFVCYKLTKELVVYIKSKNEKKYTILKTYPICASSGILGPKNQEGDYQVPEGFYEINRFNPTSSYFLSLGISYPNLADKKRSISHKLGGDIFIHGSCVTIGCLPMTDEMIKEIYLLAINAKNNGQNKLPIYLFPFEMTDENLNKYGEITEYKSNKLFWRNLKEGYDLFILNQNELKYTITKNGVYVFS